MVGYKPDWSGMVKTGGKKADITLTLHPNPNVYGQIFHIIFLRNMIIPGRCSNVNKVNKDT